MAVPPVSAVALAGIALLAGLAVSRSAPATPDTRGVRLHGPSFFPEVGPGSAPQFATTLVLEYRLS